MSQDITPFKAPERYPDPPKDMYYDVPKTPSYQKPAPIFPWEKDAPKPNRVFPEDEEEQPRKASAPYAAETIEEELDVPVKPTSQPGSPPATDIWQSFNSSRGNAWDDIPEIERYIGALQKNRKGNIQVLQGYGSGISNVSSPGGRRPSMKLTDFPTELERPSLPVTPAPVRRPSFWGEERDEDGELPAAEGVPAQADWVRNFFALMRSGENSLTNTKDPSARLEDLARRQSDVLAHKLGKEEGREIPLRPLPFGSEGVKSPTYVLQTPPAPGATSGTASETVDKSSPIPGSAATQEQPSFTGPGAMFEKDEAYPTHETPLKPSEEELDAIDN
jgi:glycogenin glucosyltransferase